METEILLYIFFILLFLINASTFTFLLIKIKKLSKVTKSLDINNLKKINEDLENLKNSSLKSFQKTGIVKFNPFKSMGGNLSFAVAILNALNEGILISGLHNRESTRTYIKEISSGKDSKVELSSEEKKALEDAIKS